MKATIAVGTHIHPAIVAMPQGEVACAWCGQQVGRKVLSGARLSHTICRPCTQQFLAETTEVDYDRRPARS